VDADCRRIAVGGLAGAFTECNQKGQLNAIAADPGAL